MFFIKQLVRDILMEPRCLGPDLFREVRAKLASEIEGQCLGRHGYVIAVQDIKDEDIESGHIENDSSFVHFTVRYTVLLLRPFKHEVLDALVSNAYDEKGFFANVGPLQIFVSRHNIPGDIKFSSVTQAWVSDDRQTQITQGSVVRLRILGVHFERNSLRVVGTINEAYLGEIM
jgi:DNA-directed RNA polymerase II subunit RPB7|eukprot:gene6341-4555_t